MGIKYRCILIVLVLLENVMFAYSQEYLIINDRDILVHIPAVINKNIVEYRIKLAPRTIYYKDTINNYYVRYYQDTQMYGGKYDTYCGIQNFSINNIISGYKEFIKDKKSSLTANKKYERRVVIKQEIHGYQTDIVALKYKNNHYEEPLDFIDDMVELEFVFLHEKFQFSGFLSIFKEKSELETIEDDINWAKQFLKVYLEVPSDYFKDVWD